MTTDEITALRALIAHWRHSAAFARSAARQNTLRVCADELEAVSHLSNASRTTEDGASAVAQPNLSLAAGPITRDRRRDVREAHD